MTENNELTRSLARVEDLINGKQYQGAINLLWIAQNHALTAVKLINDQNALLTKQQLEIITLNKDVEIQKERADMQYKRARSAEAEIKELDEQEPAAWVSHNRLTGKELIARLPIQSLQPNAYLHEKLYARPVPAHKFELEIQRLVAMNDSLLANEKRLIESLRSMPAKSVPDGYVLAPIDPSPDMLMAARDWSITKNGAGVGNDQATGCYKAMISAAKGE